MYVCICNGLNQKRVLRAIRDGCRTVHDVYARCGVTPQCGMCGDDIAAMIRAANTPATTATITGPAPTPESAATAPLIANPSL